MIKEAIDRILSLAPVPSTIQEIEGRKYIDTQKGGGLVPLKKPKPEPLTVHTLSGIIDYLAKEIDYLKEAQSDHFIQVVSPTEVVISAAFNGAGFFERPEFLTATFEPPQIRIGDYVSLENFIIGLQAYFVQDETTAQLLKLVGNVKDETVMQFSDDGRTQAVSARTGISMVEVAPVPNPITLRPFRTFPEIEQPESLFICRLRQQKDAPPACGLWEADNKLWKVKAITSIAEWLKERLPDVSIIA